jgi:cellulose synthase (UDP-forming)
VTRPIAVVAPVPGDARLAAPDWQPGAGLGWRGPVLRLLMVADVVLAARYLWWLLEPGRSSHAGLYVLLVGAEGFNLVQALGFWWTISRVRARPTVPRRPPAVAVDVFIPTYNEPVEIVEPTVAAAMALRGADVRVALLDDGGRDEMAALARRLGARYIHRPGRDGAKAGNVNYALRHTDAPFVAILDCDHVPNPAFLLACLAEFDEPHVALVQTPQYYANWRRGGIAEASWAQQSLFFGTIAPGRDELGAMFCCGTNVVFRRPALDAVGGFSPDSLTEDFELSIRLHERGWTTKYLPHVLASGLGPEDAGSYVSQQLRWARGCLAAMPTVLAARLPFRIRMQYLLSAAYWLTGWTLLVYMSFPIVRILTGAQPIDVPNAEQFMVHWGPYFLAGMTTVAIAGRGRYSYDAFAVMSASFWIHILATILTVLRRKGSFAVTPKQGSSARQIRPVVVPLVACALLVVVAAYGLLRDQSPATVTNVSFAAVHVLVLASGIRVLLHRPRPPRPDRAPVGRHRPVAAGQPILERPS